MGFQQDMRPIHAAADVVALCSDGEPLGICVTEAMSMETPVVVTHTCGAAELIEDGESGRICKAGDAASLATALGEVLSGDAFAKRLAAGGREAIVRKASVEMTTRQLEETFDEALALSR